MMMMRKVIAIIVVAAIIAMASLVMLADMVNGCYSLQLLIMKESDIVTAITDS